MACLVTLKVNPSQAYQASSHSPWSYIDRPLSFSFLTSTLTGFNLVPERNSGTFPEAEL
jgi:hypothetical protein